MSKFYFETDAESESFCTSIADEMVSLFGIGMEEAVGRINRVWAGMKIVGDDVIYHEDEEYWAKTIYYGKDSNWWLDPTDLSPLPYP